MAKQVLVFIVIKLKCNTESQQIKAYYEEETVGLTNDEPNRDDNILYVLNLIFGKPQLLRMYELVSTIQYNTIHSMRSCHSSTYAGSNSNNNSKVTY